MTNDEIVLSLEENGFCQYKKTQTFEKHTIQNNENILILVYLENSIDKIRKDLDAIEKMGATHVLIEANVSFDVAELGIVIN